VLLDRVLRRERTSDADPDLAADARAMRLALDSLHADAGSPAKPDVAGLLRDLFDGEVAAPTADVAALKQRGVEPADFYAREVRPAWAGLSEAQRAARVDGLLELSAMLAEDTTGLAAEMGAAVRTKTLVVAWAFDITYGYLHMVERGELP
jgi:hypothetical protein